MKYLGQTFSYLKKNFWLPVVAMLIPSIAACFLSTPYWEVSFVAAFDYMPFRSASQTFRILFGDSWQYLWPVVIIAILQVVGAALIMSAIDRHFRTGRLSLRDPLRMVNTSIFPMAIGVTVMSVFSIVWRFLLFGLVMLTQVISNALSFSNGATIAIISAIAVILFVLHAMIIMPLLFWSPVMAIYGYRFRDAAATSFKLISGKKLFLGLLLPMIICAGIQLLIGFLQVHFAIAWVVGFFVFMFTNVYITVYTMISFYDISDLDRRDLKPYRNIPLPVLARKSETTMQNTEKTSAVTPSPKTDEANGAQDQATPENGTKKANGKKTSGKKPDEKRQAQKTPSKQKSLNKESGDGV